MAMRFQGLVPGKYHELDEKVVSNMIKTGEPVELEREFIRKDASTVPVPDRIRGEGNDGKTAGLAAIVKDITERKWAEENLHSLSILRFDTGIYRRRNSRWSNRTGKSSVPIAGMPKYGTSLNRRFSPQTPK